MHLQKFKNISSGGEEAGEEFGRPVAIDEII